MLFLTIPGMAIPHLPDLITCPVSFSINQQPFSPSLDYQSMSYDDMLDLITFIEQENLDDRLTSAYIEQLTDFMCALAVNGSDQNNSTNMTLLQEDIYALQYDRHSDFQYAFPNLYEDSFSIVSAVYYGKIQGTICKNWVSKQCHNLKKFVKKHKTAIIIGAVVVVAVAATVVAIAAVSSASASAAAAAGAAGVAASSNPEIESHKPLQQDIPISKTDYFVSEESNQPSILKIALDEEIFSFKEYIYKEHFFQPLSLSLPSEELSLEENGRILGSLFAHNSFQQLQERISNLPQSFREIQNIKIQNDFSIPITKSENLIYDGHQKIDSVFSTEFSFDPMINKSTDFKILSYQVLGERALTCRHWDQAVHNFGRVIELEPTNPLPYLERGIAHFNLGEYDRSLEDYHHFVSQTSNIRSLCAIDFGVGFVKGLPKGIYDSGTGIILFFTNFVRHPFHTSEQLLDSFTLLANLVRNDEWGTIGEALAPEIHQLVTQWDTLPSTSKGELAGYAFGKYGADILTPGALVKIGTKSIKSAQELASVCKNLQIAQETLILETATGIKSGAKIGNIVREGQTMLALGEDVGLTAREMAQLKRTGSLENTINNRLDKLVAQSESEVLKAAINKDAHVKMIKDYLDKPSKEIQKGIKSYEKQIAIHKDKIENPTKHYPDWNKLDPRQREALIKKKWPTEINIYEDQKNVLQSILQERLSHGK